MIRAIFAALTAMFSTSSYAQEHCKNLDDIKRLQCYDNWFLAESDISLSRTEESTQVVELTDIGSVLNSLWELSPEDKRGTFIVRTHQANFVLPYHYSSNINKEPTTPTLGASDVQENYKPHEAKIQISLRAKMLENVLLPNADLWFAYTQTSLWQVWNSEDSAPFRSTDYQPEIIYVVPTLHYLDPLPFGWNMSMVQLGFAHQSNGQSEPLSRSWNRYYVALAFEREQYGLFFKTNRRIKEKREDDDNPDLTRFIGTSEVAFSWVPGTGSARITRRLNWHNHRRGAWQLDLTYPLSRSNPESLRLHLQLFSGYGETLLDYNHRQNTLGLGVMLFNF